MTGQTSGAQESPASLNRVVAGSPQTAATAFGRSWRTLCRAAPRWRLRQLLVPGLTVLVTATMLVWFVTNPLFDSVLDLLSTLRLPPLLLATALIALLQWLRGWRFSILLRGSIEPPCWRHFKLAAQLSFLNLVLPFKIGDFSFPLLARRTVGATLARGTVAILWCRLNDLCVVVAILLLCGVFLISPEGHFGYRSALAALGVTCLLMPLALARVCSVLRSRRRLRRLRAVLPDDSQVQYGRRTLLALTVGIWSTQSLIACLTVLAVMDDVPVIAVTFAGAASNLAFALPVTGIAGLGPPQAAWVAALSLNGISWDISIASALLMHCCFLVGMMLIAGPTMLAGHDRRSAMQPAITAAPVRAGPPAVAVPRNGWWPARPQRVGTGVSPR